MRLLAPLLCLAWAAVAHADEIDTAIAAAVAASPRQVLVVHFNHPLCPYSPSMKTELAAAKVALAADKDYLRILTVDVTSVTGKALALKYNVGGTPSLKLWVDAKNGPVDLSGGRTSLEIADAVLLHWGPAVRPFATAALADVPFWRKYLPVVVLSGFTATCTPAHKKVYTEFAQQNRDKAIFLSIGAGACQIASHAPTQTGDANWFLEQAVPIAVAGTDAAFLMLIHMVYPRLSRRFEPMGARVYNRHVANDVAVCWLFEDLHLTDAAAITARETARTEIRKLFAHHDTVFNPFTKGQFAFVVSDLQVANVKATELGYTNLPGINIGCEFNGNKFFHNEAGAFTAATFITAAEGAATTWKLPTPVFGPYV